ncbi:Ca2+ regulator and membrane fusion protein Fig1-domain-containing protein [Lasiosphaeris hirsuta]|uniref:Ca2+ regulator and membrane fusion protein Fig1-domain-containing protein n=1 Tax=Lasiosphaeris hirsuta TaxID=260670 RepID=A0AA40E080_9PEZI|nr:Ca2+ regulator and membrane fusion protein Fig1-domain-containing protein [Lasiosphaeris hirsuta]
MAALKLAKTFLMPSSTIRLVPYVLILPVILFQALSLSGCASTSPAIPNIYIVSLQSSKNLTIPVEVRLGYFGICGDDGTTLRCQPSSGSSAEAVAISLFPTFVTNSTSAPKTGANTTLTPVDVKDLITTALDLQSQIFISILAGAAFLFAVGIIFLFLFKRDASKPNAAKPLRSAIFRRGTYGLLYLSTALVFTTALATTETAGALQYASNATRNAPILMHAGRTLQVLQWMAFGFSTLFTLAVPILVRPGVVAAIGKGEA